MSAVSSSNTYTKTFTGINGAGKRLAEEVSLEIYAKLQIYVSKVWTSNFCSDSLEFLMNCFMLNICCFWSKQVMEVVKKTKSLKRISFLAHSLGGLFARYAIAVLYSPDAYNRDQSGDPANNTTENSQKMSFSKGGTIAGLEPINFITLATPHLGVRGRKQVCS